MITLKPQWALRQLLDGSWALTSENYHQQISQDYVEVLKKAETGIDPDSLSDAEFDQLNYLVDRGYLNMAVNDVAPAWELSGAVFHSVQEQFKHTVFAVVDNTDNKVGESITNALLEAGLKQGLATDADTKLVISVSDSYLTVERVKDKTVLPVVCNRMRVSLGPMVFPWSDKQVDELVRPHEHYLPKPNYKLPKAFEDLQRAWINVSILQMIGQTKLRYVDNFIEFDMSKQMFNTWPVN